MSTEDIALEPDRVISRNSLFPRLSKFIEILKRVNPFIRWVNALGMGIFFIMVCLTFIDVILRYVFNRPIKASVEITEIMLVIAVFLAIGYTQLEKRNVSIDLVTSTLKPKHKLVMSIICNCLSIGVFVLLIWKSFSVSLNFIEREAQTVVLAIPQGPFAMLVPFGGVLVLIVLLQDILTDILEGLKIKLKGFQWILAFGVPVAIAVLGWFWMQPDLWDIHPLTLGFFGLGFCLLIFFAGMPIAFGLMMVGLLFSAHIRGIEPALIILGQSPFRMVANYTWSVLAFFIIMGFVCYHAGLSKDLFDCAYKWLGRLPGGLGVATTVAATIFAAVIGEPLAATVAMGTVALPEMNKHNYESSLSTGVIVAGGTIGPMIPPSIMFIIYALLTEQSVGEMFMSGVFPGLLLMIVFSVYILIACARNPKLGPPSDEVFSLNEKMASLRSVLPTLILVLIVIGGMYSGIFTPTEGGGIGAAGSLIIAFFMRRLNFKKLEQILTDSGKLTAMAFTILTGTMVLGYFITTSKMPLILANTISELNVPAWVIIVFLMIVFLLLGCFMPSMPLLLLCVPIFYPIAKNLGFSLVWFGTLTILNLNLACMTPPYGINLFGIKGVARDTQMKAIFLGAIPFCIASLIVIFFVFVFPPLALWLPRALR